MCPQPVADMLGFSGLRWTRYLPRVNTPCLRIRGLRRPRDIVSLGLRKSGTLSRRTDWRLCHLVTFLLRESRLWRLRVRLILQGRRAVHLTLRLHGLPRRTLWMWLIVRGRMRNCAFLLRSTRPQTLPQARRRTRRGTLQWRLAELWGWPGIAECGVGRPWLWPWSFFTRRRNLVLVVMLSQTRQGQHHRQHQAGRGHDLRLGYLLHKLTLGSLCS